MNARLLLIYTVLVVIAASCKSRKKNLAVSPINLEVPVLVNSNKSDSILRKNWEYFSSRIEADYHSKDENYFVKVSLRMRRDSIIWFSVTASIGIPVAKGIITRDSVILLDNIAKTYTRTSIRDLEPMVGAPVGLRDLQNLIIGNPVFDTMNYQHDFKSRAWVAKNGKLNNFHFAKYFASPDSSYITQTGSANQFRAMYRGSKSAGSFNISETLVLFGISDSKTVRLDIGFTTASSDFIPSYPFVIPRDYTLKN